MKTIIERHMLKDEVEKTSGPCGQVQRIVSRMRLLEKDHSHDGWPAVQMKDISALCDLLEDLDIFKFSLREKVKVVLAGRKYIGTVHSRLQSHTVGNQYAVWSKYKHGTEAYWFSEREISKVE